MTENSYNPYLNDSLDIKNPYGELTVFDLSIFLGTIGFLLAGGLFRLSYSPALIFACVFLVSITILSLAVAYWNSKSAEYINDIWTKILANFLVADITKQKEEDKAELKKESSIGLVEYQPKPKTIFNTSPLIQASKTARFYGGSHGRTTDVEEYLRFVAINEALENYLKDVADNNLKGLAHLDLEKILQDDDIIQLMFLYNPTSLSRNWGSAFRFRGRVNFDWTIKKLLENFRK